MNRQVKFTPRNVVGAIIFALGILAILGAVGRGDYAYETGQAYTSADMRREAIQIVVGLAICAVAVPIGGAVYYDESEVTDQNERDTGETEEVESACGAGNGGRTESRESDT